MKSALRAVLCLRDFTLVAKHFVNVNVILVFAKDDVIVFHVPSWPTHIYMGVFNECRNNDHTCLFRRDSSTFC